MNSCTTKLSKLKGKGGDIPVAQIWIQQLLTKEGDLNANLVVGIPLG